MFCVFLKQSIKGGHPSNYLLLVMVQTYEGAIYTCHSFHYTEIRVSWISALNLPAFCFAIRNVKMKLNLYLHVIEPSLYIVYLFNIVSWQQITVRKYMSFILALFENNWHKILTLKYKYESKSENVVIVVASTQYKPQTRESSLHNHN